MFNIRKYWLVSSLILILVLMSIQVLAAPVTGEVNLLTSIYGNSSGDGIGRNGYYELPSGNIVIASSTYGGNRGAVTCLTAAEAKAGNYVVSDANSLVGDSNGDRVGNAGIVILANGNYVVISDLWDNGAADVGAVTWVNGSTCVPANSASRGAVVSASNSLVGANDSDRVGLNGVIRLTNGNYVVSSQLWDVSPLIPNAGAATWGSGTTGITGVVSAANSLVGSMTNDQIGNRGIVPLTNGNYVVASANWDNGIAVDAGAVTWGNGTVGISGTIDANNSFVGTLGGDAIGSNDVIALTNGNYVFASPSWDNGLTTNVGAVTWGNGATGTMGEVTSLNSLIGERASDEIGSAGLTALANGNYVVHSPYWNATGSIIDAGAATFGNGAAGTVGLINAGNSLVGSKSGDFVGNGGSVALDNGNYVVVSTVWDADLAVVNVGAVTWGSGTTGVTGAVSSQNSFTGASVDDFLGIGGVVALENDNYVVVSPFWDNGVISNAGAVTWGNGTVGSAGVVNAGNSLVGASSGDQVGSNGVTALTNGNYVVSSPLWEIDDKGAATWGSGVGGSTGTVSGVNSIIGDAVNDNVSIGGIYALTNGNYVVSSPTWGSLDEGAATWASGSSSTSLNVNALNSLTGSQSDEFVSDGGIVALTSGNYVVLSPSWDNGGVINAGAATWGDGSTGIAGAVSDANSLVGSTLDDFLTVEVVPLTSGNYIVVNQRWNFGAIDDAGAVTWGNGYVGVSGVVSAENSLIGSAANDVIGLQTLALSNGDYLAGSRRWNNNAGGSGDVGVAVYSEGFSEPDLEVELFVESNLQDEGTSQLSDVLLNVSGGVLFTTRTVDVTVTDIDTSPADFAFTNITVIIPAGDYRSPTLVSIPEPALRIVNDAIVEGDEDFTLTLQNPGAQLTIGDVNDDFTITDTTTVTILDNDYADVVWQEPSSDAPEETTPHMVTAVLEIEQNGEGTASIAGELSVTISAFDDTATAADYTLVSESVLFPAGSEHGATQDVELAIINDALFEGDETFEVGIDSSEDIHTVTIIDNETITVVWETGSSDAPEETTPHNVAAVLNITGDGGTPALSQAISFDVTAVDDTAVSPDDYAVTTNVTFLAGAEHGDIELVPVTIVNDALVEGSEQFVLEIESNQHIVTILDNDSASFVWESTASDAPENVTPHSVNAVLNINANGEGSAALATNVNFDVTAADVSAVSPDDYSAPTQVTFASGSLNNDVQPVDVTIVNDAMIEGDETFTLTVGAEVHTVTIKDNDSAVIAFAVEGDSVGEAEGTYSADVVLTLSADGAGTAALKDGITVPVSFEEVEALEPEDFTLATTELTFVAGSLNGATLQVNANIVNDLISESTESFNLKLDTSVATTAVTFGLDTTNIEIIDDDSPGVTVVQSDGFTSVAEGGATDTYTVVLNSEPTSDVTVNLLGTEVSTDVPELVFTPANWFNPRTVIVTAIDDTVVEGAHAGVVNHTVSSLDEGYNNLAADSVNVSIADNDTAVVVWKSAENDTPEAVSPYAINAVLQITAAGSGVPSLGSELGFAVVAADVTATAADYALLTNSVTFAAGSENNAAELVEVEIFNDALVENPESFTLTMGTQVHTVTIIDNESVELVWQSPSSSTSEAASPLPVVAVLNITVNGEGAGSLANQTSFDVLATPNTAVSPDDYTAPLTVTFAAGATNGATQPVNVAIVNDALVEGSEDFTLTVGVQNHTVTINDNDFADIVWQTSTSDAPEGTTPHVVNAMLDIVADGTGTAAITANVSAPVSATNGTALTPTDYTLVTTDVTFTAGAVDGAVQPVNVTIVNDTEDENNEDFTLLVSGEIAHGVTIIDDDVSGVIIVESDGNTQVVEGVNNDTYTLVLTGQPTAAVTVNLSFDNTQINVVPASFTFTPEEWNLAQVATVTAFDEGLFDGGISTISHSVISDDSRFNGAVTANVDVNVIDNTFNLLQNGGFELAGETQKDALKWNSKILSKKNDRRKCNTDTKTVSFEGQCAFRFKFNGTIINLADARLIRQKVDSSLVSAGDTLVFNGQIKANNLVQNGRVLVKVKYDTLPTQRIKLIVNAGTYGYTPVSDSLVINGTPSKIVVLVKARATTGVFYVDDFSLTRTIGAALNMESENTESTVDTVPLPDAPEGFRK